MKQVKPVATGGIVKAEGLGDGPAHTQSRHRHAQLGDATRTILTFSSTLLGSLS